MNQGNGIELPTRQFAVDCPLIDMFAPFDLQRLRFLSATSRDIEPFIGKRAAHGAEDALAHDVADGRFHHAPGRRGRKENGLLRSEQFLQEGMNFAVEIFEGFAAMPNHRPGKGGQRFF